MEKTAFTLTNPQNGDLAFKIFSFDNNSHFDHLQRHNYYTILLITEGEGTLKANLSEYKFSEKIMCCFTPYQPYMIQTEAEISGLAISFHPDFFCIHRHQQEIASNGVLFNNIYKPPFFNITDDDIIQLYSLISQMKTEVDKNELAKHETLVLYLKIFVINTIRIKVREYEQAKKLLSYSKEPPILQELKVAIEKYYTSKHTASEYADLLNITPKNLSKLVKSYFNKTLTDLISERIIIEAKRELYLTSKPIKAIAYDLGFSDEYYFSRFFKKNVEVSPLLYRETVGYNRDISLIPENN
jgi:AraC-like DNA-binding protein